MVAFRKNLNVPSSDYALRSLYMRLYRDRIEGIAFCPAELAGSEINRLLARGHAEIYRGGYRLTQAGIEAWAKMNDQHLYTYHAMKPVFDELRKVMEDMAYVSPESLDILAQLVEHEEGIPKSDFKTPLNGLLRMSYVRLDSGIVYLTEAGRRVLNDPETKTAKPAAARTRKGLQVALKPDVTRPPLNWQNGHSYDAVLAHSDVARDSDVRGDMVIDEALSRKRGVSSDMVLVDRVTEACEGTEANGSACGDCVHKRVLDMVADQLPEVRDLLAAVKAQDLILKTLARK